MSKIGGASVRSAVQASIGANIASQHVIPRAKYVRNIHPPTRFAIARCSTQVKCHLGLPQSFVVINILNKDSAAFAIDGHFDPIPDMGWAIDSSIFIMCHATLYATDVLNHICPALDGRHLSYE